MSSVAKALSLLSHFSTLRPEIGLSQLCRIADRDKATTYRHLQALETAGFVEQNPVTKHYRLGPGLLQLAQTREATVPRKEGARHALSALADATGETAHATVLSGHTLYALCECEAPHHSIRAVMDLDTFPLHATASGLCALTFGPADLFDVAAKGMHAFTDKTTIKADDLIAVTERVRATGIAHADQSYEEEIFGFSVPVFDHSRLLAGTVAVACVASRLTPELERTITTELVIAAREITRNWGGSIPAQIEAAWARTTKQLTALEPTP